MNVTFIAKDDNYQNETTNYWFELDGVGYAISDCNGELRLLDSEGYPFQKFDEEYHRVFDTLAPLIAQYV